MDRYHDTDLGGQIDDLKVSVQHVADDRINLQILKDHHLVVKGTVSLEGDQGIQPGLGGDRFFEGLGVHAQSTSFEAFTVNNRRNQPLATQTAGTPFTECFT